MNDFITSLLNLKGSQGLNSEILSSNDSQLCVQLEHPPEARFCPHCNYRMHSKGVYIRTVYHPVLQDGRQIILKLRKRKWKCQNPEYGAFESDTFPFVETGRRVTNSVDFLVVESFRDYNLTATQIAERFSLSDTYVLRTFDRYVDLPRLKLTEAISFDEVNLSIGKFKYALVIQDFVSGEPIDIVKSSWIPKS